MRASGSSGELRVGYQQAARLGAWTLTLEPRLPRAFTFRSMIQTEHPYWMTQAPMDLAVALGTVEWLWRGVDLRRSGNEVTAVLTERPIVDERRVTP